MDEARRYNAGAEGRIWRVEDLPQRFRHQLNLGGGLARQTADGAFEADVRLFQQLHGLGADGKLGPQTFERMCRPLAGVAHPIRGKGAWIWTESQLPDNHVEMAREAGLQHVLIKVADHAAVHPSKLLPDEARSRLRRLFAVYRGAGITPIPWVYAGLYEDDAREFPTRLLRQAELHVQLARELRAEAFVINAEKGFKHHYTQDGKKTVHPHHRAHALRYLEVLRKAGIPLALSSYMLPEGHGTFPWAEMIAGVDLVMPQDYWSLKGSMKNNPLTGLTVSVGQWHAQAQNAGALRPMCPSGALYQTKSSKGWPNWHRPLDIQAFVERVSQLLVPFSTFWWFTAPRDDDKSGSRVTTSRWNAFANAAWSEG